MRLLPDNIKVEGVLKKAHYDTVIKTNAIIISFPIIICPVAG
jgi:hypothetical protein